MTKRRLHIKSVIDDLFVICCAINSLKTIPDFLEVPYSLLNHEGSAPILEALFRYCSSPEAGTIMLSALRFLQPEKQLLIYSIPFGRLGTFVRFMQFLKQSSIFVTLFGIAGAAVRLVQPEKQLYIF